MENKSTNGNFIKAMIKIANPTWTTDQIEAEFLKRLRDMEKSDYDGGSCESCSG